MYAGLDKECWYSNKRLGSIHLENICFDNETKQEVEDIYGGIPIEGVFIKGQFLEVACISVGYKYDHLSVVFFSIYDH